MEKSKGAPGGLRLPPFSPKGLRLPTVG